MKIGGYQILDLKNTNFTVGTPMQFEDGTFETLEGTRKPILVSGIVIADKEYGDCFVSFVISGSSFVGTLYEYTITVADTDIITISE